MRYYELLYIVNPNLEDNRVNTIIDEIGKEIDKYKVSIINHNIWEKKRLAYPINKNKYGIYLLLQFSAEKFDFLKDFERFLILNKSVIRHQLVRLEKEPAKLENIELAIDDKNSLKDEISETPHDYTNDDHKDAEKTEVTARNDNLDVEESDSKQEIKSEIKEEDE